ncbi:hypothetical protein D9756_002780 [Leucocoprinus leucothites]|uniref:Uncharacterized protein n=1 Tax=Leucocoprinus leucothites TaxID=201217 RepID=A0A8H5GBH6_9AGAR|nr:hypothetical protein D9756_002780 [Leucoagaricus leucothites]
MHAFKLFAAVFSLLATQAFAANFGAPCGETQVCYAPEQCCKTINGPACVKLPKGAVC